MRVSNHELTIRRNETFTLDKIIQNRDGSPYIITSKMQNPYFVITVSSTLYPTDDGYVYHAWLPYNGPKFYITVPINIGDFTNKTGDKLYPNGFTNELQDPDKSDDLLPSMLSGYINGKLVTFNEPNEALFYFEDASGNRTYKYPYYEFDGKDSYTFKEWRDYECRIIHKFLQQYTRDWIEHSYYYNIELVDGSKEEVPEGEVLNGRPLTAISEVIPILEPTKMSVLSNLKGGMRWK